MGTGVAAGETIRQWRRRRRMSQLELATAAGVSARHVSFVETGRSRPSARLVLALGEALDMPLGARNEALLAAGFAPRYGAHRLDDAPMRPVRAALDAVLSAHEPYPAIVIGIGFDLLAANAGAAILVDGVAPDLLAEPVNVLRLTLHPEGLAARLANAAQVRASVLVRLRRAYERTVDPGLKDLYDELRAYPGPTAGDAGRGDPGGVPEVATPLRLRMPDGAELAFLTTLTAFGAPQDVLLESLALEALYPADERTRSLLGDREGGRARLAGLLARHPHLAARLPTLEC